MLVRPRFVLVLDFEATCDRDARHWKHEIIEFPAVLLDGRTLAPVLDADGSPREFRRFVQPSERPQLTAFCTELTSITQADIDTADMLSTVLRQFDAWLDELGLLSEPREVLALTCGDWDLAMCLPNECARKGLAVPHALRRWCNVKFAFQATLPAAGKRARHMAGMLEALGLPLIGRHHLGIDDARNIGTIARELGRRGAPICATSEDGGHAMRTAREA